MTTDMSNELQKGGIMIAGLYVPPIGPLGIQNLWWEATPPAPEENESHIIRGEN